MKKIYLLGLLISCHFITIAQIDSALRFNISAMSFSAAREAKIAQLQTANPSDTTEGGDVNAFSEKSEYIERQMSANAPADSDRLKPLFKTLASAVLQPSDYCIGGSGDWHCTGPFTNCWGGFENQGRVNSVWVSPTDTNYILAATFGGLWKSTNGGNSWHNISDGASVGYTGNRIPGTMGMVSLAVDPLNNSNIYVFLSNWGGIGLGAAYTTDAGNTWSFDTALNSLSGFAYFTGAPQTKMMYMPGTEKLFTFIGSKIFFKSAPSSSWQDITPSFGIDNVITDMEFTYQTPVRAVFSTNAADYTGHLWIYNPSGSTWTNLNVTLPSSADTITNIDDISLSASDSVFMLVEVKNEYQHLIKKFAGSSSVTVISTDAGLHVDLSPQHYPLQYLVVNPLNTQVMYGTLHNGAYNFYQSVNGGVTFEYSTSYGYTGIKGNTHADARYLTIYKATTSTNGVDDVLYGATDGGVVKKRSGHINVESITGDSLCITQFFGMSNAEGEDDIMIGGAQDNGRFSYNKLRAVPWASTANYGDNMIPQFLRNGVRVAYAESDFPSLQKVAFGAASETEGTAPNPDDACNAFYWSNCNNAYRPWQVDKNNNAYIGYRTVWKMALGGTTWSRAFTPGIDPKIVDDEPKVADIAIAEADTNTMYVAYRETSNTDPTETYQFHNPQGKLYYSTAASGSSPNWTNITPPIIQWWPIDDIEIEPTHPQRIWVGLGGSDWGNFTQAASNRQHRVQYSPNAGVTWYDVSRGLPALSVNKILYQRGSNEQLYCATALGIYHCDFSTFNPSNPPYYNITWECFNNGMPLCEVTGMEMNYCASKLRASTMGRGIWESNIGNSYDILLTGDTITTNTTWSTNQYITGGIVIKPGATLTITGDTVHMPRNGTITVQAGGKLVVDSAVITNDCDNCMWYGIQAKGNSSLSQTLANQGYVVIKRKSVIAHARYAFTNCDYWNYDFSHAGGIIQATNSTFLNDHAGASFYPYHNYIGGLLHNNVSYFTNCTFRIDSTHYKGDKMNYPFTHHCYLNGVEGVRFTGCNFINSDTAYLSAHNGDGIYAYNAGFSVQAYCTMLFGCSGGVPSRFCGLLNGINIGHDNLGGTDPAINIDRCVFDTVSVGVLNNAVANVSATRSTFTIGNGNPVFDITSGSFVTCHQNIGIFIQNTPQFRIEGNDFEGHHNTTYTDWRNIGVAVANTKAVNTIYRSTFNNLDEGVYALGCNRLPPGTGSSTLPTGLQVLCNAFSNNYTDIAISVDGSTVPNQGIDYANGSNTAASGNTFSGSVSNITNAASSLTYWYATGELPSLISPGVYTLPAAGAKSCASTFDPIVTTGQNRVQLGLRKGSFNTGHKSQNDSLIKWTKNIDYGGTDSLVNIINTSTDTNMLYGTLVPVSPYLSGTAMLAIINGHKLPHNKVMAMLTANPDVARADGVLTALAAGYTLNANDNTAIATAKTAIDKRTLLESNINYLALGLCNDGNAIMMAMKTAIDSNVSVTDSTGAGICGDPANFYYTLDSNTYYTYIDSVDAWLKNMSGLWPYYQRASWYRFRGNNTAADSIYTQLAAMAMTPADSAERHDHSAIYNTLKTALAAGRTAAQLTGTDMSAYAAITGPEINYNTGRQVIHNVQDLYTGLNPFRIPCLSAYGLVAHKSAHGGNTEPDEPMVPPSVSALRDNSKLLVYPNPSNNRVNFVYNVADAVGNLHLLITDAIGNKILEQKIYDHEGSVTWDCRLAQPGIYIYRLTDDEGPVGVGKILVNR